MADDVVEIDVKLRLDKSDIDKEARETPEPEIKEEPEEVKETIEPEDETEIEEEVKDLLDEEEKKTDKTIKDEPKIEAKLEKLIGGTKGQAGNLVGFAKNPTAMLSGLMSGLGKALPFIGAVTAILTLPETIKKIAGFLVAPGGPLDRRLRIVLSENQNAFLTREQQRNRQVGKSQVIITQNVGFRNSNGYLTTNSFRGLDAGKGVGTGGTFGVDIGTTRTASILEKAGGL